MKNKWFLFTLLVLIIVIMAVIIVLLTPSKNKPISTPLSPTPITLPTVQPQEKKINISGVLVNNFFISPKETNSNGDVLITDNNKYQILYFTKYGSFLISIVSSPFITIKNQAEQDFVKTLGISQIDACRLNVQITTPYFANPDYSGISYSLSFCEDKK